MMSKHVPVFRICSALCAAALGFSQAQAQQPGPQAAPATCEQRGFPAPPPSYQSVEVLTDGRVTFRLCAPAATAARVTSPDIPDLGNLAMTRSDNGLWSATTAKALAPDNYRYSFVVNGVVLPDPQATTFSRERNGTSATLEVPGAQFQSWDARIAHGVVAEVEYWSQPLGVKRRAHVYTPPGYLKSSKRYPVLYLVNGAGDSDDNWTSTGHAHYILDNLIAAGKAKPMIIVMPAGHTPDRPRSANILANADFGDDLLQVLVPYIDANYRTVAKPAGRAMAGLSMGGAHTLQYGLTQPQTFRYIGVFSMGLGLGAADEVQRYETANAAALARSARDMKLVYYAVGREDFLFNSIAPTRAMLDRHGIKHLYNETGGGHTWINWRRYLADLLPRLF
jgi:enterochelin esterase-like enzyme